MNKIDKRTGKEFPSVTRQSYRDSFGSLTGDDRGIRQTIVNLDRADWAAQSDTSNNWTLDLDPESLREYGAFLDAYVRPDLAHEQDSDDQLRPVEWYLRVGQVVKDRLSASDPLWEVINDIFDQAIDVADKELGFTGEV